MRIGMLADIYKPHISGVTHAISANKRLLEEWGHEVFVFTFGDPDFVDDEERVIRSPGLPLVDTGYYFSFRYSAEAVELLRTMDVVHVHHPFLSGRLALRYCRPWKIPVVFTNHTRYDLYAQAYLPLLPDALGDAFLQAYLPTFCRAVDLVVSPSAGMAEVLRRLGVDVQIRVIPNGVDLSLFKTEVEPFERSLVGFSEQDVLLVYAGRIAPEKNLEFLVQAFAGVARTFERARLLVVGDGPYRENMQELVRGLGLTRQVHFTGMVPYEQLPGYLSMGDAFVTASVSEVHPLSVIEALACGLPVLGIDSPGVADTVQDGVNGSLSAEHLATFTAKMARLVCEPERRKEMGAAARRSSEQYALERTARMVLDQYEALLAQKAAASRGTRALEEEGLP